MEVLLMCKAEKELGETEHNKRKAIDNLVKALHKAAKTGLVTPQDNEFLLLFLRARKFNSSKAATLIVNYYTVRREHSDMFDDFTPNAVRTVFEDKLVCPLPRNIPIRPQVILVRVANWDVNKVSLHEIFKAMLVAIEYSVRTDVSNQVTGYNFLFDMEGLTLSHATQFTPMFAHKALMMLENAFPLRVKGLHHINVPVVVEGIFQVFRPFLSDKMRKRFAVTSSTDFIHKSYMDEEIPDYLGGQLDTDMAHKLWMKSILSADANQNFVARSQWGFKNTNENGRSNKTFDRYDSCDEW